MANTLILNNPEDVADLFLADDNSLELVVLRYQPLDRAEELGLVAQVERALTETGELLVRDGGLPWLEAAMAGTRANNAEIVVRLQAAAQGAQAAFDTFVATCARMAA